MRFIDVQRGAVHICSPFAATALSWHFKLNTCHVQHMTKHQMHERYSELMVNVANYRDVQR